MKELHDPAVSAAYQVAILKELDKFQDRVMAMAEQDYKADTVFQFNFQLFQVSEKKKRKVMT